MSTFFMELADELFDLRDAALEYQIAVVGLALGDLAGDGVTIEWVAKIIQSHKVKHRP